MKQYKIAEPDFDFVVEQTNGKEFIGKRFFTSDVSIIKCTRGEAVIVINSRSHKFKINTNFLLIDAMLFKIVECSDDFTIITCRFSLQFMNEIYPILDNTVIDVLLYSSPDLCDDKYNEATDLTFRKLCILNENRNHAYRHRIAINLVTNYIFEIYELTYKHVESNVINTSNYVNYIIDTFYALCNDNHMNHRKIEYYADRLNISSRYLYKITKDAFQSTPKQLIDYYVSGTAKKLLLTTILSIQQVADKLNFPDQATFGQFFKRNVGMSPSDFRNKYR